jgi:predicted RNase H-like HicB family nuclease
METPDRPESYLQLPYHFELVPDVDADGRTGWVVEVAELPGCISQGSTPDDAIERVRDAMLGWISVALADGQSIPLPREEATHSGRVLLRMPRSLHGELSRLAETDGVSLNQWVVAALARAAEGAGRRPSRPQGAARP